jgi:acyl transferase domain-containing protein
MNDIANDSRGLLAGAFRALEDMRSRLEIAERSQREPIAVIGLGCRFPKADNPEAFWSLLREGRDAVDDAPAGRWDIEAFYDPDPNIPGKMYTKRGAFLDRVDTFDPAFFGIAPREAVTMDPQQRLFLEVAWEALEDAGLPPDRLGGSSTGVFLGICNNDYAHTLARAGVEAIDAYTGTGTTPSVAAGRLSYVLGLQGPCMTVDTACSSSLVALDLAVQHLRSGRCDQALVGGVNLLLMPESTVYFCKVRALAPDGRCKTFDNGADGYGRGEGCGVVVLKRLSDALRDGDDIRAVVRGVAVNHDGRSNGLTAPNGLSQEGVIRAALADAGVAPHEVGYVEAHGTGTPLGDPIELAALARAYGDRDGPLIVGSAKTNICHLEAAAGVAGLIKTILALEHGEIPAHLHFQKPNAHLPWDSLPITIPSQAVAWPASAPMAGISSFGFSGTNAHVILEAGPPRSEPTTPRPVTLLTVSAPTESAARAQAGRYAALLSQAGAVAADAAFSANAGRAHFRHRAAVVGTLGDLTAALEDLARGETPFHRLDGTEPRVVFLFTGQGSQFVGMARDLDAGEPVFREVIDRCDAIFQDEFETDLRALLWGDGEAGRLDQTAFTQPALYAVECALTALWRSWGVTPAAAIGHSVGEFAAMQAAGVLSLEDGFRLVATRGWMMQTLCERGAMAAVAASELRIRDLLGELPADLAVAAINAADDVVLSGAPASLDAALERLAEQGVRHRRLTVSHAFHSPLMEPMLDDFAAYAAEIPFAPPAIPMISNLTGAGFDQAPDAAYWRRHAREAVRFEAGLATLKADGHTVFLEIGPQPVLLGMARRSGLFDGTPNALWLPSLRKTGDDAREMLEALAALYRIGAPIDWRAFDAGRGQRTPLPTYPFERQRFWLDDVAASPHLEFAAHATGMAESARPWTLAETSPGVSAQGVSAFAAELLAANPGDRHDLLLDRIQSEVKRVLRLPTKPDLNQGLFELGMDSLMAVELRSRLETGLGQALPSTVAFDHPTIERLARHLLDLIAPSDVAPAAGLKKADPQAPIAIVGLGCRFPGGANDPEAFWRLLRDGQDAVTQIPAQRWTAADWFDPDPERVGKSYCQSGGFLDVAVEDFDSQFFGVTPREATAMDPQQRLLLEVAWEALEHAGRPPVEGERVGVFVGINANDYARLLGQGGKAIDAYAFTGNTFSVAAGRLSHNLGFQGPSLAIDTACSSSLVAVHLACQSLRMGECEAALAGGVNLMLAPDAYVALSRMHALAPDGRCKTFDASADGYGRGEGCGLVVLKRLSDALADGDDVLAVIHGSAVNQDGASGGLTVPNGVAQQALIGEALERAGLAPEDIGYLEAHGTGTPLGDPIELGAAARALRPEGVGDRALLVGSAKTNIGHLEAAAGVAGLIKTVLALRHETIPRHLHFDTPNPQIEWSTLPVEVPTEAVTWPRGEAPRFAGVSSFGMSGTNAHLIVGEGPSRAEAAVEPDPGPQVITLSGRSEAPVRALAERYRPLATTAPLADIAFAASAGRSHFEHRIAVLAETGEQLAKRLDAAAQGRSDPGVLRGQVSGAQRPKIAFVFTGQGSQYAGMGKELYDREPVFRAAIDRCDALLDGALLPVLFEDASGLIDQTGHTQPALFALEYALCALWRSWGVEPSVVLGHSVGEYVAACVAGVFSLEEGLKLVARRAQLMQALPPGGAMAAVWASEADLDLSPYGDRLSLAAVNGPGDLVVSGEAEALDALRADLERKGVASRPLTVSHAFHSPLMAPILEPFADLARTIDYQRPQVRLIRDLDGDLADGPLDADYWTAHLRRPVRFHDALRTLQAQDCTVVIEIGPHPILTAMAKPPQAEQAEAGPRWLPSLRRKRGDLATLRETLAGLYVAGAPIDWTAVHRHQPHNRIHLPTYPFQRKPYWMAPTPAANSGAADLFHEMLWRVAPLSPAAAASAHSVLIFADRSGVAERLAASLTAMGQLCTLVRRADDMADADYRLGSLDALDQELPHILQASGPSAIAYLWNLDLDGMRDADDSCGELTALHLIQGVLREAAAAPPRLWFVSRAGQPVGDAAVAPHQAPLWGVGRALSLEHPEAWGGLIDLAPEAHADEALDLARQLLAEGGEDLAAFRGGERLVARLAAAPAPKAAPPPVRPDASYLITGGLGSLGRAVARWLAEAGARSLVLAGRSRPTEAATADIAALEAIGVRVTLLSVDVGDRSSLAPALAEIAGALPPLRGIVHAAGILDDGVLFAQTDERFVKVMRPKARGAWNLHDLTKDLPLDFFVMFSSAATLFGSPGQANYSAANAFLDGLAHHRRSLGLPALSVGWGPWRDIGMAADLARRTGKTHAPRGVSALAPTEALQRLGDLMSASSPQVAVMPVDWPAFMEQFAPGERPRALDDLAGALPAEAAKDDRAVRGPAVFLTDLIAAPARERRSILIQFLQAELAAITGDDALADPNAGFFDMGLDSLMAVEMKNRLGANLDVTLPATVVFRFPNITALTDHLLKDVLGLHEPPQTDEAEPQDAFGGASEAELLALLAGELEGAAP